MRDDRSGPWTGLISRNNVGSIPTPATKGELMSMNEDGKTLNPFYKPTSPRPGTWWWFDEVYTEHGPYDTYEEAYEALKKGYAVE